MSAPGYARDPQTARQARLRAAHEVMRGFGALAWYGGYTGLYWAMVDGRWLVEAKEPQELGERIMSARRRQ